MSQLDDKGSSPSLDEGSEGVAGFSFYRQAAAESKERNPTGNPIWKAVWEARRVFVGKFYGRFHLNTKEDTEAFLVTEAQAILAHQVNVGWIKSKKGRSFPNRENVLCKAWELDDKGRWKQTGKVCPLCLFLGKEPRLIVLWALLDAREEQDPNNNRTTKWNLKYMTVDSDDVRDGIFNACGMASRDLGIEPTTRFAKFFISRSGNEKSSAYGTSWIFRKFFSEQDAMKIPQVEQAMKDLPPWLVLWPIFKSTDMVEMCRIHKKVHDDHNLDDRDGYSSEGAVKVLGPAGSAVTSGTPGQTGGTGQSPSLDEGGAEKPSLGDGGTSGPSLDDLASGSVPASNRPTLEDLAGAEANPENPTETPAEKPEPTADATKEGDGDDWVPYDDPNL
jgi:hypothetical protein